MGAIPLSEVQGFVLRSYGMDTLRLFVLRVDDADRAHLLLADLVFTSGAPWTIKPDYCINVAFTHEGLAVLGVPPEALAVFPVEFMKGAAARGAIVGDNGESAPANWRSEF